MSSLAVGSHITTEQPVGVVRVLATVTAPGIATCNHRTQTKGGEHRCACPIQRTSGARETDPGSLEEGVRAHYRTVHPERGIR